MFEKILLGVNPSDVFKEILDQNPDLLKYDLSDKLIEYFPNLDSQAVELVWHWKSPGREQGLSDKNLDAHLLKMLREAKYLNS